MEDIEFFESRVPYTVDVMLTFDLSQPVNVNYEQRPDFYSDLNPAPASDMYNPMMDGMLTFTRDAYDQQTIVSLIEPKVDSTNEEKKGLFSSLGEIFTQNPLVMTVILLLVILGAGGIGYAMKNREEEIQLATLAEEELEEESDD